MVKFTTNTMQMYTGMLEKPPVQLHTFTGTPELPVSLAPAHRALPPIPPTHHHQLDMCVLTQLANLPLVLSVNQPPACLCLVPACQSAHKHFTTILTCTRTKILFAARHSKTVIQLVHHHMRTRGETLLGTVAIALSLHQARACLLCLCGFADRLRVHYYSKFAFVEFLVHYHSDDDLWSREYSDPTCACVPQSYKMYTKPSVVGIGECPWLVNHKQYIVLHRYICERRDYHNFVLTSPPSLP